MKVPYLGIQIDLDRDNNLSDQGKSLIDKYYMLENETSPQHCFARAAVAYCFGDYDFAQRIYDYASKQWFGFASPVLSNAPENIDWSCGYNWKNPDDEGIRKQVKNKGLPISCYLTYVGDNLESLIGHTSELRWLSVKGGGVGGHWSHVRSVSDKAPGPIPFLKTVDSDMTAYRQGTTRKGSYAAYLDISHPDIMEFISLRVPNGDIERKCQNLNNAVNITDKFLDAVLNDLNWDLVDPNEQKPRETVKARDLWQQILEVRNRTGEPYICFIDEANRRLPFFQRERGLKIHGSNLCSEIMLATDALRTAVCCLSSLNLEYWDDWRDTNIVQDLIRLLDNVLEMFIILAPDALAKAKFSAIQERSLGLGAMGFHAYLQRKSIPWESAIAKSANIRMFRTIRTAAEKETIKLAQERGNCPDQRGWEADMGHAVPRRNTHLLANAPTANNSMIANTSPGIEPRSSNAVVHKTRAGTHLIKNRYLDDVINTYAKEHEKDQAWIDDQWKSIVNTEGSVQHLNWLTDYQKHVFKTAFEIDQRWVIDHARDRQEFIDQGQSVNLFFPSNPDRGYVNQVHLRAFLPTGSVTGMPLKSLYYYRTKSIRNGEKVGQKVERLELKNGQVEGTECLSCHG